MKTLLSAAYLMAIIFAVWAIQTCRERRPGVSGWLAMIVASLAVLLVALTIHFAHARDLGQWDAINSDSAVRDWYRNLMRPTFRPRHAAARPTPTGRTRCMSATARPMR